MVYAILGLTALVVIWGFGRWMLNAQPHQIRKVLGYFLSGGLALFALFLFARGAIMPALGILTLAIPPLLKSGGWFPSFTPSAGQQSNAATDWLEMSLDHDSGEMDGKIKQGAFAGQKLSELTDDDLKALYDTLITEDADGARLLAAWIERMRPHMTEDAPHHDDAKGPTSGNGKMGREEALEILGLSGNPSHSDIREAWRRLIARAHPDQGGSEWLAARINQAKDVLMN